jgi:hypothetical protein
MGNNMTKKKLIESTPAEQAKSMGLTYGGFGGWVDASRTVVAKTINGQLVKVDPKDSQEEKQELEKLNVFRFDPRMISVSEKNPKSRFVWKYNQILKAITSQGAKTIMLIPRGTEQETATYLRTLGMGPGVKLSPMNAEDPNKVRDFVSQKIKAGHSSVDYYDTSEKGIAAVHSLKAQFNRLDNLNLKTHQLTSKESFQ